MNNQKNNSIFSKVVRVSVLSFEETCRRLSKPAEFLLQLVKDRKITYCEPVPGDYWFKIEDIEFWATRNRRESGDQMNNDGLRWG